MAGKNVPFRIAFVSSQEDDNSAEELLQPGPCSRGWASSAYSIYPQVKILYLVSLHEIHQKIFVGTRITIGCPNSY